MSRSQYIRRNGPIQQQIPERYIKKAETYHHQSHHCPATKCNPQPGIQRFTSRICRTGRGISSCLHPQESRQSGEKTSCKKSNRYPRILYLKAIGHNWKQYYQTEEHPPHNLILLFQIRHGTFAHSSSNLNHLRSTFTLFHHLLMKIISKAESQYRGGRNQPEKQAIHRINIRGLTKG